MSDDLSIKYLRLVVTYLQDALRAVVESGEFAAKNGDEFDEVLIGRAAYDFAATALIKIIKEEDVLDERTTADH